MKNADCRAVDGLALYGLDARGRRAMVAVAVLVMFFAALTESLSGELRYWVWNRDQPLSANEIGMLEKQSVRTVYWHAATLEAAGDRWSLAGDLRLPPRPSGRLQIVPVIRLSATGSAPLGADASQMVAKLLGELIRRAGSEAVQVDFDCPDRRLEEYAGFLRNCREQIAPAQLSVTALAGWSRSKAFESLQRAANELVPMFYDLAPDRPESVRTGRVLPIADASTVAGQLESWKRCRTRWYAGLPNFARVTIFDVAGRSRGHLRSWTWDEIAFAPELLNRPDGSPGVALLTAARDAVLADTPIAAGELIACRWPDLHEMLQAVASADRSGAAGVALFRLPGTGAQSGWSLAQLGTLFSGSDGPTPSLKLTRTAAGFILTNTAEADLSPRLAGSAGPHDRGWQLEVEVTSGAKFREASPGEFAAVYGHTDQDSPQPTRVPLPLAHRLTYWFSELRAGCSRESGILQLAPGTTFDELRWRIPGSPRNDEWQRIE